MHQAVRQVKRQATLLKNRFTVLFNKRGYHFGVSFSSVAPLFNVLTAYRRTVMALSVLGLLVGMASITLLHSVLTQADTTIYWDGGASTANWSDAANWSTDVVPTTTDHVLIDVATTVNIAQPITVSSLTLGNVAGSRAAVLNFAYDANSFGPLTLIDGDLIVYLNSSITHSAGTTIRVGSIDIAVQDGNLVLNGTINADGKGYARSEGLGQGVDSSGGAGGGGYGGSGGSGTNGAAGGAGYGNFTQPTSLGSGGGDYGGYGAAGGGAIKVVVSGTATINGTMSALGANSTGSVKEGCCTYRGSGGGSGGSIWIQTNVLAGSGSVMANGGTASAFTVDGGGGGGGRIALHYANDASSLTQLVAQGGRSGSGQHGGAGTIYRKPSAQTYGDLRLDNESTTWNASRATIASTSFDNDLTINSLTVADYSRVQLADDLTVIGTLTVSNYSHFVTVGTVSAASLALSSTGWYYSEFGSTTTIPTVSWVGGNITDNGGSYSYLSGEGDLTVPAGSTFYANVPRTFNTITINGTVTTDANSTTEVYKVNLTSLSDITLSATGSVNVDYKGYSRSEGPGQGVDSSGGAGGGGYGGAGGSGSGGAAGGSAYGDPAAPDRIGSGGGDYGGYGTAGGGAIKLVASGTFTVNGTLSALGQNSTGSVKEGCCTYRGSGGGSGGSIWIQTNTLAGNGHIVANGGTAVDVTVDGGGGGGGRVAIYYSSTTAELSTLTANGGSAAAGRAGSAGTIVLSGKPSTPVNLRQYKSNGIVAISTGADTDEASIIATFQVLDGDGSDTITPQVEIQPVGTVFNDFATHTGTPVAYSGSLVTASVTLDGLAENESYHWQARACDAGGQCSAWTSYGNNAESARDVRVVLNQLPNTPTIPSSSSFINAQYTNSLTPTLGFVLSDGNATDTVKYRIQIDTVNSFASPDIDYTSALAAQGTQYFTVGQAVGSGSYTTGNGATLSTGNYYWRVMTIDSKDGVSGWTTAAGTPAFIVDQSYPTNASAVQIKASAAALHAYDLEDDVQWFSRSNVYFSWTAGSDAEGVKGYCLYLGPASDGDPAEDKGLLGVSPVSTTGTDCDFITDDPEIDFSTTALRGAEWLTSSNDLYYFKVKTIDVANNVFNGVDDTNYVSFKFDNTPPTNVTAISATSDNLSNTADAFFTWPTSVNHTAADSHSQVLGFQYALNDTDVWYGDQTDVATGADYYVMGTEQPFYFPDEVQDLIQMGQNILYFRVLDQAGNVSELRTANINYGGEAPKFSPGASVTVTPDYNTENSFAFSWPDAIVADGNTVQSYYYMINTPPPVSYATITYNSATYIATDETSIPASAVAGLRKGGNTIYVVAVDQNDGYASTNAISATFILDTELPDPPANVTIADSSIKDASIWRASLVWNVPEYLGTGNITYHIQRSEDGVTWTDVGTTTGTAYVDTVTSSRQYYWRVGSSDNSDTSIASPSYSNSVTLTPKGKYTTAPGLTSGPAASSVTTSQATLTWTTDRSGDSRISYGLASGNYQESEPSTSEQETEHKIVLTNLKPGTKYYYKAKWTDEDGNTGTSEEKTFTTEPPPLVQEVAVSNIGISSASVNFTTVNASSAKVYYGTSTNFGGVKSIGTSKLETEYTIELDQLEDGVKYYYKINTFDAEGLEYEGTILDFETVPRPEISGVTVQQITNTAQATLALTWESNTEITSIVTYYPEGRAELVRDAVDVTFTSGEHEMIIRGLFPDTNYVVRVSGRDRIGNEAESNSLSVTTSEDNRAPLISDLRIEGANAELGREQNAPSQLIVTWVTDEPATSQVEFGEGSGDTFSQLTQEDSNLALNHMVIIPNLTPSKVYHLRVISKDKALNESRSVNTVTITPKATDSAFELVITNLQEAFGFLKDLK